MRQSKRKRLATNRERIISIVQIILILFMLVLIWKIASHLIDEWRSHSFSRNLQKNVIIMEEPESGAALKDGAAKGNPGDTVASKKEDSKEYVTGNIPASIDFELLREISEDAVAWLYCPDTKINYVIAQAEDNEYYLHRLLDGSSANCGTLFMDYRCNSDFTGYNTVIYGHHMKDESMFASLVEYQEQEYYEEHPVMYLYVPGHRYTLELIAGYITETDDLIYSIPATKKERDAVLENAYRLSNFEAGIIAEEEDRIVTLSTCSYAYDDGRYVVIGRIAE